MYFIVPEAVDDIDEAVAFYLQGSRTVAVRFIEAVYSAIQLVLMNPYLGAAIGSGFRGFALKRFPLSFSELLFQPGTTTGRCCLNISLIA